MKQAAAIRGRSPRHSIILRILSSATTDQCPSTASHPWPVVELPLFLLWKSLSRSGISPLISVIWQNTYHVILLWRKKKPVQNGLHSWQITCCCIEQPAGALLLLVLLLVWRLLQLFKHLRNVVFKWLFPSCYVLIFSYSKILSD